MKTTLAHVLVLAAIVALVVYAVSLTLWPWTACGRCSGTGRATRADGRVWRDCRSCKGSGRRRRFGA